MRVATDVHYWEEEDRARAAVVGFVDWGDGGSVLERVREHRGLAPYEPGEFFRRELPCLLPLLRVVRMEAHLETVMVDGYVDLGDGRPGLGRYLWDALGCDVEVIGIAKSRFVGARAAELRRRGTRPLWVTATGDLSVAVERVARMHGDHRIPTLLKRVDELARSG